MSDWDQIPNAECHNISFNSEREIQKSYLQSNPFTSGTVSYIAEHMRSEEPCTTVQVSACTGHSWKSTQSTDRIESKISHEGCSIASLPPELLLTIFQLLPVNDLLHTVPRVCELWHQLSLNPSLHKRLVLHKDAPAEAAIRSIRSRSMLTVLRCPALVQADAILPCSLPLCTTLQCLNIGFCTLNDDNVDLLGQTLPRTLKHLNIEGMKNVGITFITHLATRCKMLEALNLSHCLSVCDNCVRLIAENLNLLQRLNLDGIPWITDAALQSITESTAFHSGHFASLWLDGLELSSVGVQQFVDRLAIIPSGCSSRSPPALIDHSAVQSAPSGVRVLWISFCNCLTGDAIQPIAKLTKLVSLTLRKAEQVTAPDWINLFETPANQNPVFGCLEYLDLSETPSMNDYVLTSICKCCGPRLRSLMLNWCLDITDAGLEEIVNTCCRLRNLSLVGNYQIYGTALVDVPEKVPCMRILNLTQCNQVLDSILNALSASLPHLYIFDYYGEQVGGQPDSICHYDLWRSLEKISVCAD